MRSLSQEFVASQLHLSQPAYSKIEHGKTHINADLKEKLATIMGVEERWFEDFSDSIIFNNTNCTNSGYYNNLVQNESIEKLEALYKRLLEEQDKYISKLEQLLNK